MTYRESSKGHVVYLFPKRGFLSQSYRGYESYILNKPKVIYLLGASYAARCSRDLPRTRPHGELRPPFSSKEGRGASMNSAKNRCTWTHELLS